MFKVMWLCRFKEGIDPKDARRHWHDVHGQIALTVPGILGYVQNYCAGEPRGRTPLDNNQLFDGYSVAWFADRAGYEAAIASPEWAALHADTPNLFDGPSMITAFLDEKIMRPVPRDAVAADALRV